MCCFSPSEGPIEHAEASQDGVHFTSDDQIVWLVNKCSDICLHEQLSPLLQHLCVIKTCVMPLHSFPAIPNSTFSATPESLSLRLRHLHAQHVFYH
jgi:hypothetical protein